MARPLLVVSENPKDVEFGSRIATRLNLEFTHVMTREYLNGIISRKVDPIVFWDASKQEDYDTFAGMIEKYTKPKTVFAITDQPLQNYPHLFRVPIFSHHFLRRFEDPCTEIASHVVNSAMSWDIFGLARYLPKDTKIEKIQLKNTNQRTKAVQAIENYITKKNVASRLSTLVAQATDELILNAIFSAPVTNGRRLRQGVSRDLEIELKEKEIVSIEFGMTDEYVAIAVGDEFGSLRKKNVLDSFKKHYEQQDTLPSAGLGLHSALQQGLSLLFLSKSTVKTQVVIFFPRVSQYRDFRNAFRFFSLLSD